jgi:hypothetical protein
MDRGIRTILKMQPSIRKVALALAVSGLAAALPGTAHAVDGFSTFSVNATASATIRNSVGVKAVDHIATGVYRVTFNHIINTACSFTVSPVGTLPAYAVAFYTASGPNALAVRTFNPSGVAANSGFAVIVTCGP